MNSKSLFLLLCVFAASCTSATAQSSSESDAQRQLREDRERFNREVERQATEARIREERARASASEQRTAEELERLRAQQSRQTQTIESLRQRERLRESAPISVSPPVRSANDEDRRTVQTVAGITPDVSITFLADGNCVIYLKGRAPEVHAPADAEKIIGDLLRARAISQPAQKN